MPNGYQVRTETFEGPLDLLLSLIEKRRLHINDVSLSVIADDYLIYIEKLEEFPTKDAAQFLVVASTLVLLKSRSLLPTLALSAEEESSISDLEERLKLLSRMRGLTGFVGERFGENTLFYRETDYKTTSVFSPTSDMEKGSLAQIVKRILKNLPQKDIVPHVVVQKIISMEEMMDDLTERIKKALSVSFKEFAKNGGAQNRAKVVIGFLALLELVKRDIVLVKQNEQFEDIEIEGTEVSVPRYY